jgi:hypothetical protein
MDEAAARFNEHAGKVGTDPVGRATMTGPHLCEVEKWPRSGKGQAVELPGRASVSGYTRLGPVMLPEWFASAWDR